MPHCFGREGLWSTEGGKSFSQILGSPSMNIFFVFRFPLLESSPTLVSPGSERPPSLLVLPVISLSPTPPSASCLVLSRSLLPSVFRLSPTPGSPQSSRLPGAWVGSESCLLASAKPRVARMAGSLKWECPP